MGTNNFHNKNASRIFACELQEDYSYQFLQDNIDYELKEIFKTDYIQEEKGIYENRSYPANSLGYIDFEYRDCRLRVLPVIRGGYYGGCNLDYEIEYCSETDECENLDGLIQDLQYLGRPTKAVEKAFNKQLALIIEKLEKIFTDNSTPLIKTVQFQDGTAVYEAVK